MKRICTLLLLFTLLCAQFTACSFTEATTDYDSLSGRFLIAENGKILLVDETGGPIVLKNCTENDALFEGLQTGDLVEIAHDGIEESYPAGTGVYGIKKLESGGLEDIPAETLNALMELGWHFAGVEPEAVHGADGTISFYTKPTSENRTPIIAETLNLTFEQTESFKKMLNLLLFTDNETVDRLPFNFDCELHLDGTVYYVGYNQSVLYYSHYFADLSAEQVAFFRDLRP